MAPRANTAMVSSAMRKMCFTLFLPLETNALDCTVDDVRWRRLDPAAVVDHCPERRVPIGFPADLRSEARGLRSSCAHCQIRMPARSPAIIHYPESQILVLHWSLPVSTPIHLVIYCNDEERLHDAPFQPLDAQVGTGALKEICL